ncbi:MAG: hypothetical protein A2V21_308640 [Deltaproteobacteria bacterium GWC2_55_46]|nr:MAG: hypothetical protein A2Z79_02740 [Deltaproteobacteria bacterium GWA2_55_82]OIJ74319.1 MAG: hypothetical protein A2V21_308640 [Deltaproteobacteria bacterium GWC2_55_46]
MGFNVWTIFHSEASLGWGGQEIRILNESLGMKARGHRVIIIAQDDSLILEKARLAGLDALSVSFRKKDYPKTVLSLVRSIKKYRPDIVNTHSSRDSWLLTLASRLSKKRPAVIRTRHISTPVSVGFASSLIYRRLPDKIVTTAEAIREALIERNGVDPGKVVSIPTGIDTAAFDPGRGLAGIRQEIGAGPDTPVVGMVSVLRSWKGHEYFIEAARFVAERFPLARFVITGDGPRKGAISEAIASSGLGARFHLLGHRDDVPNILSSLDIFVQPSYANEGVPQSVLQAMAMGVPVVATDLKPFKEIVKDRETGLLAPVKDPQALADRISEILADARLSERLSKNARALALKSFSIESMLDRTEELYSGLLSSRSVAAPENAGTKTHSE